MSRIVYGGWTGVSDPLELQVQLVVSCLMWMLQTGLGSSGRVCTLNP